MRDSNPRGREPNPLSNPATASFATVLDVYRSLNERRVESGERWRTVATETETETGAHLLANEIWREVISLPGGSLSAGLSASVPVSVLPSSSS